jgi:cyanophycin synthetase
MAPLCDGEVIFYGIEPELHSIAEHRSGGGRAVFLRDRQVTLAQGDDTTELVDLTAMRRTRAGRPIVPAESVLAAVGAAVALELSADVIVTGIETFDPGTSTQARIDHARSRPSSH